MKGEQTQSGCLPGEGDRDSDSGAEAHQSSAALAEGLDAGRRWRAAHPGEERQRGLLTLLEAAQQQQQVLLLVDQCFAEAFRPQVLPIHPLERKKKIIKLSSNKLNEAEKTTDSLGMT